LPICRGVRAREWDSTEESLPAEMKINELPLLGF
jgi:hypothetical protein